MEKKVFSSALSRAKSWKDAVEEVAAKAQKDLDGKTCDLAVFFVSEAYENFDAQEFSRLFSDRLSYRVALGCNSSGVVGSDTEVEMEPALSILAMHLPGVKLYPFQLSGDDTVSIKTGADLIPFLDIYPTDRPRFLCLADPMTADVTALLHGFNEGYKGSPVVGGLASGAVMNVPNWLYLNGQVYKEGAIGVVLVGDIEFDVAVSQGCRPIDKPYVITKAEQNVLYELAGRSALEVVRDVLEGLPAKDRTLAEQSLSVGLAMSEQKTSFHRGDFLIRNIMGFDPDSGSLMVGAVLKVGQTLQFQIRDSGTSSEDLRVMLEGMKNPGGSACGGVLVSCCGRGKNFYGHPHHDVHLIQGIKGPLPLTGFFANGEIGPVGQKNYVHGYTSSLVIFK